MHIYICVCIYNIYVYVYIYIDVCTYIYTLYMYQGCTVPVRSDPVRTGSATLRSGSLFSDLLAACARNVYIYIYICGGDIH